MPDKRPRPVPTQSIDRDQATRGLDEKEFQAWRLRQERWTQVKTGLIIHLLGMITGAIGAAAGAAIWSIVQRHMQYIP